MCRKKTERVHRTCLASCPVHLRTRSTVYVKELMGDVTRVKSWGREEHLPSLKRAIKFLGSLKRHIENNPDGNSAIEELGEELGAMFRKRR